MPPKVDYKKLIDEMVNDEKYSAVLPGAYTDILKTFLSIPGIVDIFDTAMKNSAKVRDDKMDVKKFYLKIKKLIIEMSDFYGWQKGIVIPNNNVWNEETPMYSLPYFVGVVDTQNEKDIVAAGEYEKIKDICFDVQHDLTKLTTEDFEFFNTLHKKYTKER